MEQLLHYVWKHKLFDLKPLQTVSGETLEIIDPGLPNAHAGPDFFNAKIKINGMLWVGNVEIHRRASDWLRHQHQLDKNYDSVILHVAELIDCEITRSNGEIIPQLALQCPSHLQTQYRTLLREDRYPSCFRIIPSLSQLTVHSWLNALQSERFARKTQQIGNLLNQTDNDWEQAFFIILARNFGFGVNSDVFELWARNIPLQAINKHRDSLFQIEAFFFGQAGLLEELPADDYSERLIKEYGYLRHKFGLHPSSECRWKLLRMRPGNFPHIRIAQLACLYHRSQGLFSQLMETADLKSLRDLFKGGTSEYWLTHYRLGELSEARPKALSSASIDLLIINTVVPFLYAFGKRRSEESLLLRANRLLEEIRPENNHIIRLWGECGIKAAHAGDSQALIELKKNYCDTKKCLYCRFGYEYLKAAAPDQPA